MRARAISSSTRAPNVGSRTREAAGILLLSLSLFVGVSLVSLLFSNGRWLGPGGAAVATALYQVLGLPSLIAAYALGWAGCRILLARPMGLRVLDTFGMVLAVCAACVLGDLIAHRVRIAGVTPGGMLGEALVQLIEPTLFRAGAALVAVAALAIGLVLASHLSFTHAGRWLTTGAVGTWRATRFVLAGLFA